MRQESALQAEIMLRLAVQHPELHATAIPNGMWLFGADRKQAAVIIRSMKRSGLLTNGAADIVVAGRGLCAFMEVKPPARVDLFGKRRPAGMLSDDQKAYRDRCIACGNPHFVVRSWPEVEAAIAAVWKRG